MGTFCLSAHCQGQESTKTLQPGFADDVDDYDDDNDVVDDDVVVDDDIDDADDDDDNLMRKVQTVAITAAARVAATKPDLTCKP